MILTDEQRAAMATIAAFLDRPAVLDNVSSRVLTLSGRAGVGKTTLLGEMQGLIKNPVICAPTNKATNLLHRHGFAKATTLDRVVNKKMYVPVQRPMTDAEIMFYNDNDIPLVPFLTDDTYQAIDNTTPGLVVVVDESSMTTMNDFARLTTLYTKVIFVGDSFQLPPPDSEAEQWFQSYQHDIELTQTVRTSSMSEITQIATMIRNKDKSWSKQPWNKEVTILGDWREGIGLLRAQTHLRNTDIMLVFKNDTCDRFNPFIRQLRGLEDDADPTRPMKDDLLLAWNAIPKERICKSERYKVLRNSTPVPGGYNVSLLSETDAFSMVVINKACLQQQRSAIAVPNAHRFSYGHAVTTHKSQGGEWDRVVLYAGDKTIRHEDYWNWLYTAVTRAKKHLTILL